MKSLALLTAAATLAVAHPLNSSIIFPRDDFQGSINWFKRYDCRDDCVENGMCLAGQTHEGMDGSADPWVGWDSGCWDRPEGANSVALSVSNGHRFSGINKSCKKFREEGVKEGDRVFHMQRAKDYGDGKCNVFDGDVVKAVFYHW